MTATAVERAMAEGAKPQFVADASAEFTVLVHAADEEEARARIDDAMRWLRGRLDGTCVALAGSPTFHQVAAGSWGPKEVA